MSQYPGKFLGKHKKLIVFALAISVISLYVLPVDELAAAVGGKPLTKNNESAGKGDNEKNGKPKDNNCENGLPPHKNGNSDNGNHFGCLKNSYQLIAT